MTTASSFSSMLPARALPPVSLLPTSVVLIYGLHRLVTPRQGETRPRRPAGRAAIRQERRRYESHAAKNWHEPRPRLPSGRGRLVDSDTTLALHQPEVKPAPGGFKKRRDGGDRSRRPA